MEEELPTREEAYWSAVDKTIVHFFALARAYRVTGRRLGMSYARIWAESYLLFEAIFEDAVRAEAYPLNPYAICEGVDDACDALAAALNSPLYDFRGVAYFDQVVTTWLARLKHLRPQFTSEERIRTGYPLEDHPTFHFRANAAMVEVPLFLLELNGITIRPVDTETLRQRVKHLAARHVTHQEVSLIGDYLHGVEIAMFCVEQIIAVRGALTAAHLLELLEDRLEDFWVPQRSPFDEVREYPFDPADEAHYRPGHWPKMKYGL